MPLSVMLDTLEPEDFHFYRRLYNVQPFGYRRDEFNTGLVASTIMNAARQSASQKVWAPKDFMPLTQANIATIDPDEMNARIIEAMVCRQGRQQKR